MKFSDKLPDKPGWWAYETENGFRSCILVECIGPGLGGFFNGSWLFINKIRLVKWSTAPISFDDAAETVPRELFDRAMEKASLYLSWNETEYGGKQDTIERAELASLRQEAGEKKVVE